MDDRVMDAQRQGLIDMNRDFARECFKMGRQYMETADRLEDNALGHECGHEWVISVISRGHSSGVTEDPSSKHSDSGYSEELTPVKVRAHDLRSALRKASYLPLSEFLDE